MRFMIRAGMIIGFMGTQLMAVSVVSYTAGLGGDNHVTAWESGNPQPFTAGSQTNGQTYAIGTAITWDVTVQASGIHEEAGHPANGFPIWGMANVVFDLELRSGSSTGPLVSSTPWFSTINDGDGGDPLRLAAFASSFNVAGNGPGRLIDPSSSGGPRLNVFSTPAPVQGGLVGMGAGYSSWRASGSQTTTPGVGMATLPNGQPGLGLVPIGEGQIDTNLLTPGIYFLKVIPAGGNNVLRGDKDLYQDQNAFAVAANQTFGDEINFVLIPEPTTLFLFACVIFVGMRCQRHV